MNKLITLSLLLILSHTCCHQAHAAQVPLQVKPRALHEYVKQEIIVAVIDTGIDTNHALLKPHLWINPGESGYDSFGMPKASNGIDDDKNGYVDDIHGWNFTQNNNQLEDSIGHGTHISGIITGNSLPRAPVQDLTNIKIMTLKYFQNGMTDEEAILFTIAAIDYAIKMGAKIINYSSSGAVKNVKEEEAIRRASQNGILFITAAGNSATNIDDNKYYPAKYDAKNIISVSSVDEKLQRVPSSNFSMTSIPAPGKSITSTLPNNAFGKMTGTSQATAFVTAKAASLIINYKDPTKFKDEITLLVKQEFTRASAPLIN